MQTVLILHPNERKRQERIDTLCEELGINVFDKQIVTLEDGKEKAQTIGIKTIRQLQQTLYLMPSRGEKKALIIPEAHLLTPEAQNALLKTLEEPPEHAVMLLGAPTTQQLLPTVLSRCVIEKLDQAKEKEIDEKELDDAIELLKKMADMTIAEKLVLAQKKAVSKQTALSWISLLLTATEKNLRGDEKEKEKLLPQAKMLFETYEIITTTNASPRLAIERFLISSM